ncbi:MAG TPA: dienelactone hydrolase family protein [Gemmatimonadales bacterium]|nr:dienelactone hydrolase family protein [Gemmatimonadales bacterium]
MPFHHIRVGRTARYHQTGVDGAPVRELWFALHGYSQLAERFAATLRALDDGATAIVVPEALSRFYLETGLDGHHGDRVGASWLTREDRDQDLEDHLAYLDLLASQVTERLDHKPRVGVLGFSQGSVMAARWALRGAVLPDRLVLWGASLPGDVEPRALADRLGSCPIELVAGDRDPFVPENSIEAAAHDLRACGASANASRFSGGHLIAPLALLRAAGRSDLPLTS